ncbi:MAG: 2-dehydropantoate 2-reductase [Deltaproteobacteria bacterium]|nr:2-dehydropantoate 2-reductase [Deltaproteobacteria bacterium]
MTGKRYAIYGAGGVGASLGAQLVRAGRDVRLIARGDHLRAMREQGLLYRTPARSERLRIPAFGDPEEAGLEAGDAVVLAMKTQDSLEALRELERTGIRDLAILCAQNGVHNEQLALRRFERVYGLAIWIPASFTEAGVVSNFAPAAPIDLGRIPSGSDEDAARYVADLCEAGFDARLRANVLDWKYTKLLTNVQTTLDAICGSREGLGDVCERVTAEVEACYAAAGIRTISHEEHGERIESAGRAMGKIDGLTRKGGSSTQSIGRGLGSIETDYINGEIVLLGRLHGVPTPANATLQAEANAMATLGSKAQPLPAAELRRRIQAASDRP